MPAGHETPISRLQIPHGLTFGDLAVELAADGGLRFLPAPLQAVARINGLDADAIVADEDRSCAQLVGWYVVHREAGGDADAACESFVALLNMRQAD